VIDLGGSRVLVTGGSRGIGAACCRRFAAAGAAVLVQYRTAGAQAEVLVDELSRLSPGPHLACRCDLAREEEVRSLFALVVEQWQGLDCLVNNAGVWVENPLAAFSAAALRETLAVNVEGPFLCAREAAPLLARAADGCIVNVTSTAGQRGEARYSPYAASKGAMISATKSWAVELAPRVRVNSVAPGWVETDMTAAALATRGEEILATIPLRRIASPDDIAGPVLFLASPLARNITGEILNVNGGSVLAG
jgi:3-oxoacyl-[acyl-carrier protein] reductase